MPHLEDASPAYEQGPKKSIEITHSLEIVRLNGGKPILTPKTDSPWESKVVLNPAAVLIDDMELLQQVMKSWDIDETQKQTLLDAGGATVMLYRAQGEVDETKGVAPSSAGLAVFTPTLELVWRRDTPAIAPVESFHNLGVEDGRCTFIDGTFYFFYTGYYFNSEENANKVHICLATTKNFIDWELHGPIPGNLNDVDNKNAVLLPEKVNGKWVLLHRPMFGEYPKALHWAISDSLFGPWKSKGMVMASYKFQEFSQSWIGAGGPPIALGDNKFLTIYHQGHYLPDHKREYDLSATILHFPEVGSCIPQKRIEPLMRPTGSEEQKGDENLGVDNVLFICANYKLGEDLILPYAGADSRIFGAKINMQSLIDEIEKD